MIDIAEIVKNESKAQTEYLRLQQEYLAELKELKLCIANGETVDTTPLVQLLIDSGIVGANGELKERYCREV